MHRIYLIRHGLTAGNLQHRYVGRTDEPLCQEGIRQLLAKKAIFERSHTNEKFQRIYTSPMLRCRQTAELLFAGNPQKVMEDFRELDFGEFEYKNYEELTGDARYQAFIDSGGKTEFPGAEPQEAFRARVRAAFARCIEEICVPDDAGRVDVFVLHGGTIMAILEAYGFPKRSYFDWQIPAGEGFCCECEYGDAGIRLTDIRRIGDEQEQIPIY